MAISHARTDFALWQIIKKNMSVREEVYCRFVDLMKAYNKMNILHEYGIKG